MKKVILILSIIFFFREGNSQPVLTITEKHDYFTADEFGNIYTVSGNEIKKFNSDGVYQRSYSGKGYGPVTSVDVSNPMKILLFYRDFSTIIFLDNTLSLTGGPVNLAELGASQVQFACTSYENGFWVYDPVASGSIRFDYTLKRTTFTGDMRQLLHAAINPVGLLENNRMVYLADSTNGIIVFDVFGGYIKTVPLKIMNRFQISNEKIYYLKDNLLMSFGLKSLEEKKFKPENQVVSGFHFGNNRLIVSDSNEIAIYNLQ